MIPIIKAGNTKYLIFKLKTRPHIKIPKELPIKDEQYLRVVITNEYLFGTLLIK